MVIADRVRRSGGSSSALDASMRAALACQQLEGMRLAADASEALSSALECSRPAAPPLARALTPVPTVGKTDLTQLGVLSDKAHRVASAALSAAGQ